MYLLSQLTSQWSLALPEAIRQLLEVQPGDAIYFNVLNGQVVLSKNSPAGNAKKSPAIQDPDALALFETTFGPEWHSALDDEAFEHLQ